MLLLGPAAMLLAATFTGQVVCAGCWDEADRAKVRYGTDEDVACAKRCAKKGIGQSLAVRDATGAFTLYPLEARRLPGGAKALLDAVGAEVSVEGEIATSQEKPVLRVDALKVLPATP